MAFLDFLFGKDAKTEQFQRFTPQQQDVFGQMLGGASQQIPQSLGYLQQILSQDPEMMRQFEAPSRRAFEEQTIPSIAERFTGMDAQKSSAFGQQLGQAGASLEEALGAQRAGRGSEAIQQLMSMLSGGLTPQFETGVTPGSPGFLQGVSGGIGQGLGQGMAMYAGGPAGVGAGIAGLLMKLLQQGQQG